MKYYTINLNENKIEIHNSILGKETIKVNDEIVSSKYSIFGAEHNFEIVENGKEVKYKIVFGFSVWGLRFDLYKDKKAVITSDNNGIINLLIFVIVFVLLNRIG